MSQSAEASRDESSGIPEELSRVLSSDQYISRKHRADLKCVLRTLKSDQAVKDALAVLEYTTFQKPRIDKIERELILSCLKKTDPPPDFGVIPKRGKIKITYQAEDDDVKQLQEQVLQLCTSKTDSVVICTASADIQVYISNPDLVPRIMEIVKSLPMQKKVHVIACKFER